MRSASNFFLLPLSSWPISRIPLAFMQTLGDHLSGSVIANTLVRPTRTSNGTSRPFALLGLAPGGVCLAGDITAAAGGLLHRRFTLTRHWRVIYLSVALFRQVTLPGR